MSTGLMPCASVRAPVTPLSKAGGLCRRRLPLPWLCPRAGAPAGGWSRTRQMRPVQEALPGGRAGIDGLLRGLQDRAARPDSANYVLQVSDASGEAIDAGDHQ